MTKIYYRSAGTKGPTGSSNHRDLWYRVTGGRVQFTTFTGSIDWRNSGEYTPADIERLPVVPEVGSIQVVDPDLIVDEGL